MHSSRTTYLCNRDPILANISPTKPVSCFYGRLAFKTLLLFGCALAPAVTADARITPKRAVAATIARQSLDPLEQRAIAAMKTTIADMTIRYEAFTLANGLRVFVIPDDDSTTVAVNVWYDVGAKFEPAGRSGFAHLFEHLMFNGSENVPGDYLLPLMDVGASVNGNTSADRTNYYEVIPPTALDRALFMEADRMGHLLGAVDQASLDEQRGVVQNEKRQGDNSPVSIVKYRTTDVLYGPKHPYGHSVIGSMTDLKSARLEDVKSWFHDHYGPNNAVLVIAGKVTLAGVKPKVEQYFGSIPRGPANIRPVIHPAPLARTVRETLTAPIPNPNPIVYRSWPVPGVNDPQSFELDGLMAAMNDEQSLTRILVREKRLFDSVSAMNNSNAQGGQFVIDARVHAGVDPKVAAAALDAEIASFLAKPIDPTPMTRFAAKQVYSVASALRDGADRGALLGEGILLQDNPDAYRDNLRLYASLTPAAVSKTARRWLLQPRYELTLMPGPRITPKDDEGADGRVTGKTTTMPVATPAVTAAQPEAAKRPRTSTLPAVAAGADARFPSVEYATLSNGIRIRYAPAPDWLFTMVDLSIEGSTLNAPPSEALNLQTMYSQMKKAFSGHDKEWIQRRTDLLGISLGGGISERDGSVFLLAANANLAEGLKLLKGVLSSADFPVEELDRWKRESIDRIPQMRSSSAFLTDHVFKQMVDTGSPITQRREIDSPAQIRAISRESMLEAYHEWLRPERTSITLVSAKPLAELVPLLDREIGTWKATGKPSVLMPVTYQPKPAASQIVLIDMKDAVQATVYGGQWVDMGVTETDEPIEIADAILAKGFSSRLNMNLREDKHWTYGVNGGFHRKKFGSWYQFSGTIQQDKVGAAIEQVRKEVRGIVGETPITAEEFRKVQTAALGSAAAQFSAPDVIAATLSTNTEVGRPDTYPKAMSQRIRDVDLDEANAVLKSKLNADRWIWVIAGNADLIRPQLAGLGLPTTTVTPKDIVPF